MAQLPKTEVLYMYLLIEGQIRVRLNIVEYVPGTSEICWDATIRQPKHWAVCGGPVCRPPEKIYRKGFQGFRYTLGSLVMACYLYHIEFGALRGLGPAEVVVTIPIGLDDIEDFEPEPIVRDMAVADAKAEMIYRKGYPRFWVHAGDLVGL
jgi:hypothetical protein